MARRRDGEIKDTGDPYINIALSVLREAKIGDTQMWRDYKAEFGDNPNVVSLIIAQWVSNWQIRYLKEGNNG